MVHRIGKGDSYGLAGEAPRKSVAVSPAKAVRKTTAKAAPSTARVAEEARQREIARLTGLSRSVTDRELSAAYTRKAAELAAQPKGK